MEDTPEKPNNKYTSTPNTQTHKYTKHTKYTK